MTSTGAPLPHWLAHLGVLGLFTIAIADSSVVPLLLPGSTDLLLLWLVAHGSDPWLLAPVAILGGLVGGYTTWRIGKRGGERALPHYVSKRMLRRIVLWVERHPLLSVFLPAVLPPPIPLSPFVLASGALGVSRNRFLLVFGAARSLRYGLVCWLGAVYGRQIVRVWSATLEEWTDPMLWAFAGLFAIALAVAFFKLRGLHK